MSVLNAPQSMSSPQLDHRDTDGVEGSETHDQSSVDGDDVNQFSIYLSSVLAMTALAFVAAGAPAAYTFNLTWGIALGAMAALWVGPGFGLMVASARVALLTD